MDIDRNGSRLLVALATLAVAGCSGGGSGGGGGAPAPTTTTNPGGGGGGTTGGGTAFGLTQRVPLAPLAFPATQPTAQGVEFTRAFPNLLFREPTFLTHAPDGTDRIFVLEQAGRILVFPNRQSVTAGEVSVFLDITAVTTSSSEQGLLGLAFDPGYATNGYFYIHYIALNPRRSRLARFRVSAADANRADRASESVILEVAQPYSNHNGGMVAFGPDGMLYTSLGDGGSGGDPDRNGQDLSTLLGSLIRIDVRGFGTPAGYRIPADNPFVATPGARGEIWAYGLRHPWRFSFDRGTGRLFLADVGQGNREELDVIVRGGNYGWRVYEGTADYDNPTGIPPDAFRPPVLDYGRSVGNSITGGYVYRGAQVQGAAGTYFYADYGSGRVFAAEYDGARITSNAQVDSIPSISSFGEDAAGELYALSYSRQTSATIYKLVNAGGSATPFPQRLSDTGLFADTASLRPAPGLIEYDVNAPLWSDGASKRRWLALPGTSRITFDPTDAWGFPQGTVLVKHFELEMVVGDPSSARRLETRVLVNEAGGWAGYVYRWNAAQTDADLLPDARATDTFTIVDPAAPGGQRQQTYAYPSRADCNRCHTQAAGFILGLRTRQVNRDFAYPNATDNQLRSMDHIGLFTTSIGAAGTYEALADPSDASAPIEARARSYLDASCAMCHLPGGPAPGSIDLRVSTARDATNLVNVRPTEGTLGLVDAYRVKPGVKESSVLWERVRIRGADMMPPLATNEVDPVGVDVLGRWIDSGAN